MDRETRVQITIPGPLYEKTGVLIGRGTAGGGIIIDGDRTKTVLSFFDGEFRILPNDPSPSFGETSPQPA